MKQFIGIVQHEFKMSIRRRSLWIGNGLVVGIFLISLITQGPDEGKNFFAGHATAWQEGGDMVYMFNMLLPLVAGILASDRLKRDNQIGIRELQLSSPVREEIYLAGKFTGVLFSAFVPLIICVIGLAVYGVTCGLPPVELGLAVLAGLVTISIPTFVFVTAFSLVCPLVIPVRIYQILFTGYWFWGNFLSDKVLPTVSGTVLNASGIYALQGFFLGMLSRSRKPMHTPVEACLNIAVLLACALTAMAAGRYYLVRKTQQV
jgi:ABC-type transport system involved in multi-copper enzyme maturation permease subunit